MPGRKFSPWDRVVGNDKRADFRQEKDTVVQYGTKGQHLVRFDTKGDNWVDTDWIEKLLSS